MKFLLLLPLIGVPAWLLGYVVGFAFGQRVTELLFKRVLDKKNVCLTSK